ncbi:type VI secretion system Vgr family protein [Burkholderia sp. H160]|nr:type VI secretion system Vgr family protein [Burkholderia sp. H160]
MFNPLQARTLSVSSDALPTWGGEPVLAPARLAGAEALGKLYRYEVDLTSIDKPTLRRWEAQELVVPENLIGKTITIAIEFEGKGTFVPGLRGNIGAGTRTITGLMTDVEITGSDDRHAYYRVIVRPWLWLATRNCENRIFQNLSVVEITEQVLKQAYRFPIEMRLGALGLQGAYPKRDYVRQMWESDLSFLTRIWREWGIYYFFDGETLVLCDSPGAHQQHCNAYDRIRYHAPDDTRIDEEHIHRLKASRKLTAGKVDLVDYDYTRSRAWFTAGRAAPSNMAFDDAGHYQWGDYSQPLAGSTGLSGEPNDYVKEAEYLARVRVDALRCKSQRLRGTGNLRGLTTGKTFWLENHPQNEVNAEYLVVSTRLDIRNVAETTQPADRDAPYQCVTDFVLQPANVFFKNRPKKKPRCSGETAVVVGPENQPMWVDGYARIKVQFVWDRLGKRDQNSSCWLRVSSPWQGAGYGIVALPRIGQEVGISYHEGDPDKPYVSDRMVNQFNQPPWQLPKNQALTGLLSRSLENGQSNHVVADDTPGQLQVQVASDHAQSRLVLGYNTRIERTEGRAQARGEGFELATEGHGVARANRGLLITTETRAGALAPAKDMGETVQRLASARELHEDMGRLAQRHKAQMSEASQSDATQSIKAQNDAIRGGAKTPENPSPEMTRADLVLASSAGLATTAAESTHLASQSDHVVTAGRDVSIASGRSLLASVRGMVSFFAAQLGIRLFAAKGKVEIQAQSDQMALAALKDITISSTDGRIVITASKEVWIGAQGSYIKINGEGIENGTPGRILEKCASWNKPGAASMRVPLSDLPYSGPDSLSQKLAFRSHIDGAPIEQVPYSFFVKSDEVEPLKLTKQGSSDASGSARIVDAANSEATIAFFGQGEWTALTETDNKREAGATGDTNCNVDEEKI